MIRISVEIYSTSVHLVVHDGRREAEGQPGQRFIHDKDSPDGLAVLAAVEAATYHDLAHYARCQPSTHWQESNAYPFGPGG